MIFREGRNGSSAIKTRGLISTNLREAVLISYGYDKDFEKGRMVSKQGSLKFCL